MTRDEVKKLIAIVKASYPNFNPQDLSMTVEVWAMMLGEYQYNDVAMALKTYITTDTSGFAPSIGQLVEKMHIVNQPNELNEMAAWGMVSKAIRNSGYHSQEEFDKLPELVKKCVGSPEQLKAWAMTDVDSIENVVQSNFMRTYRAESKRAHEISKMPMDVRNMIAAKTTNLLEG